jgi:schlafen family protein
MINKAWDKITKEDIERLVTDGVAESHTLDYKQELPNDSPQSRLDFLCDVAAFANASGGDLIFGIREKREVGKPTAVPEGFERLKPRGTWDETKRTLESAMRTGIEPTLAIKINHFEGLPEGPVLIVRVPPSWAAPHMVTRYGKDYLKPQFYMRHNGGNHPMDMDEIRAAFILHGSRIERLRQFREERLRLITSQAESLPTVSGPGPRYILHLLPISTFEQSATVDISQLENRQWGPSAAFPQSRWRGTDFNFEGYLIRDFNQNGAEVSSYVQIFRSGAIEAVKVLVNTGFVENTFEQAVIRRVRDYLNIQMGLEVRTPVFVMLTLHGVKGIPLIGPPNAPSPPNNFDRDLLPLPECVVDDFEIPVTDVMRTAFDALYQAAGSPRSASYNESRNWIGGELG